MKKYTKGDFDYIKFDTVEEILDYVQTMSVILYADKDNTLYCFDHFAYRTVRFDREQYKWVFDSRKSPFDFKDCTQVDFEMAKEIYKTIPPFDCLREFELQNEKETLEFYASLKKTTPRKVVGWLKDVRGYELADDREELYSAALLNDIDEHKYFFIADWMQLIPVFDDNTYLDLSSRSMGFLIGVSRGEAMDASYVDYAFGEPYFEEDDSFFNPPKEGFYK